MFGSNENVNCDAEVLIPTNHESYCKILPNNYNVTAVLAMLLTDVVSLLKNLVHVLVTHKIDVEANVNEPVFTTWMSASLQWRRQQVVL